MINIRCPWPGCGTICVRDDSASTGCKCGLCGVWIGPEWISRQAKTGEAMKSIKEKSQIKQLAKSMIMDAIEVKIGYWRESSKLPEGVDPDAFEAEYLAQARRVARLMGYESDWTFEESTKGD